MTALLMLNSSGKLPFPYPMKNGNQRLGLTNEEYRWPLGHGLSYTTFEYSGLNFPAEVVFQVCLASRTRESRYVYLILVNIDGFISHN
jgi:hypothetical protein